MQVFWSNGPLSRSIQAALIGLSMLLFQPANQQAAHWRGTYYSFAAHLSATHLPTAPRFLVDTAEINAFDRLPVARQRTYRFQRHSLAVLTEYNFMQIGYGYICALARTMFPSKPDSQCVVWLQALVHIICCLWLMHWLAVGWQRLFFLFTYACNPMVTRFVMFDFYYFWQVIPSFLFVISLLGWRGRKATGVLWGPLMGLLFATRPSVVLAQVVVGAIWGRQRRWGLLLTTFVLAVGVGGWLYRPVASAPWRPMYVGIAAYKNPYMNNLSDVALYDLFEKQAGRPYQHGDFHLTQEAQLAVVLRQEVSRLMVVAPGMFVKNAVCNTLQAFSVGYVVGGGDVLNYTLVLVGLFVLGLLLRYRQYGYVMGILATVGTFTPYYPPIPAYMYGAYLLLVMGLIPIVEPFVDLLKRWLPVKSFLMN